MLQKKVQSTLKTRPPIVTVMGHIDHGKSTLLDYIRKANVVSGEVGGITQRLTAYEAIHKTEKGEEKKITFLDTPGHEAFSKMRSHSAVAADIAILIVSAEDGVKAQTIEAWKAIDSSGIPFIVAINKIDRPNANIEKTKLSLSENEIYLEGMGGNIPFVAISSKTGEGVPELLEMVLLLAEIEDLKADTARKAEGVVLESHMDSKRGITATLILKDGVLKKGMYVTSRGDISPVRNIENFLGKNIDRAEAGMPISVTGWSGLPQSGSGFNSFETRKDAEKWVEEFREASRETAKIGKQIRVKKEGVLVVPVIIKAEAAGAIDAILHEIKKIKVENVEVKILATGGGTITENDVKTVSSDGDGIILGFGVSSDASAKSSAERFSVTIVTFDIIYKMTEWLAEELEKRRPRQEVEERRGLAKIIRIFSTEKNSRVVGGRVTEGIISLGDNVKVMRRDFEIGRGKVIELQQQKMRSKQVTVDLEFGAKIDCKQEIAQGDVLEAFVVVKK
ncbi:MAG: translation initiation factor IF-2 [Candidatus Paceibacterota bacterium]|jgi:translation initiation factor IF-2|nr:translation initiation factor IF-2 [Candidatus Paceibacterota bacterium]